MAELTRNWRPENRKRSGRQSRPTKFSLSVSETWDRFGLPLENCKFSVVLATGKIADLTYNFFARLVHATAPIGTVPLKGKGVSGHTRPVRAIGINPPPLDGLSGSHNSGSSQPL